jgi:hypothetical protein
MTLTADADELNCRSAGYLLAQSVFACWRCLQPTSVFCLGLSPGYERRLEDNWESVSADALLFYVEYLPPDVALVLQELSPQYRLDNSTTTNRVYWVNHCQHCGALLEDHDLHCEPDGAFLPASAHVAEQILFVGIEGQFLARVGGISEEASFFASQWMPP